MLTHRGTLEPLCRRVSLTMPRLVRRRDPGLRRALAHPGRRPDRPGTRGGGAVRLPGDIDLWERNRSAEAREGSAPRPRRRRP